MAFEASTLDHLEDALAESFQYHEQFDRFLLRAGVPRKLLDEARRVAEERAVRGARVYQRAPKRFVSQELLSQLQGMGPDGDRILSSLFTQFINGTFRDASQSARAAIDALKAQVQADAERKKETQKEKEDKRREIEEAEKRRKSKAWMAKEKNRDRFLGELEELRVESNPQSRGYMFEKFLESYFEAEGLDPRGSFKIVGEQIDGSFVWGGNLYLLEAKWQKEPVAGADFGAFIYKLEGKSADTRGLYVAINGYSTEALNGLRNKGTTKFVCIDGAHLFRSLQPGQNLKSLLSEVWRHVAETGEAYLPVSKMN
jgi:hypothetical protein